MLALARGGVRIVPPVPPFYQKAATVQELIDQIVGRVLDQIDLYTDLPRRWHGIR
jgi:4-hydroxy-3-polyprenylbenzoate decarboxylase